MRFVQRILLGAPPERVWEVLSDWERQASWMPDVAWVRPIGPGRELGARLEVRTKVFGVPAATDLLTVTAWEPPRRLATRHVGVVKGAGEWRLEPTRGGGGTDFRWIEDIRLPPPLVGDLALWIYSPWQRWMLRRSAANLQRLVEGASG